VWRRWETLLVEQLIAQGYGVTITPIDGPVGRSERGLDRGLRLLRRAAGPSLADRAPRPSLSSGLPADLVIDLAGASPRVAAPVLALAFDGRTSAADALADLLKSGGLPEIIVRLDGAPVGRAAPMLDNRVLLGRLANSVFAAAVSLLVKTTVDSFYGRLQPIETAQATTAPRPAPGLLGAYLPVLASGLAERARLKLMGRRTDHWQVGYRLIDGPGVAETGSLDGAPFSILADDGKRFYADPFVVERNGRHYLFVEDLAYAKKKGVISASELGPDGRFSTPRPVIEEPYHLSYPQIIRDGDDIFMLPEGSGGRELVLYRATDFPYRWERDTVLLRDLQIADATLLVRDGRHWLIGTRRPELGSSSDTMVVYSAPSLRGPWTPHPQNPIVIDRSAARPGGALVARGGRMALPVQDGALSYGGGLGLVDLVRLDDEAVAWGPVRPIRTGSAWARQGIHTLNRAGRLEVVDSTG